MERYVPIAEGAVEQSSAKWKPITTDQQAEQMLRRFVARAYRRRVTKIELQSAFNGYRDSRKQGEPIKASLKRAMSATLLAPSFLMRIEVPSENQSTRISDYELANRLSYFLWASMPDNELFRLATRNQLSDPAELNRQVERMIADPKTARFSQAFVGQWLSTSLIGREIRRDPIDEPWCTDSLMDAMRDETHRLFLVILTDNRPATDLIEADFTYATPELAKTLYGLRIPKQGGVRRISLSRTHRRGILGHAAVLAATSGVDDVNISKRGAFVLDRLLGTPPPPPPPDAGELDEQLEEDDRLSLAQKINRHARDRRCAGCHQRIDPIGSALSAYGPFGRHEEDHDNDADQFVPERNGRRCAARRT